jgi:hypothetical protein
VAFDPLSQQYLLVACANGQLVVYAVSDDFQLSQVRRAGGGKCTGQCVNWQCCFLLLSRCWEPKCWLCLKAMLSVAQVSVLAKQAAAQRRAAFVPTAPGNFVTVSDKSGEPPASC